MLNKILRIPLSSEYLTDGFVLVKDFKKIEFKKYAPIISAFRLDKRTYTLTVNQIDLFSQPIVSLEKIIEEIKTIKSPNPLKVYNDIPIASLLPEQMQNKEVEEIRNQLRHYLHSGGDIVTIEQIDYLIEIDKTIENYISYYLYEPDEYLKFEYDLNKELLIICYEWDKEEYFRLFKRIEEVQKYSKSESADKTMKYLDEVRFRFDEWFRGNNYNLINDKSDDTEKNIKHNSGDTELNNELMIAHNKLKLYSKKVKYAKIDFNKFQYSDVLNAVNITKKKNGAINYSGVARKLNLLNHHTAKKICDYYNIKF